MQSLKMQLPNETDRKKDRTTAREKVLRLKLMGINRPSMTLLYVTKEICYKGQQQ